MYRWSYDITDASFSENPLRLSRYTYVSARDQSASTSDANPTMSSKTDHNADLPIDELQRPEITNLRTYASRETTSH